MRPIRCNEEEGRGPVVTSWLGFGFGRCVGSFEARWLLMRDCGLEAMRVGAAIAEYVVARRVPSFSRSEEKSVLHESHGTHA